MSEQDELFALYEQYLDEQTLKQINEEDNKEDEICKVQKKRAYCRYPKENQITIKEFVHAYLGLEYVDCENLWHQSLKNLGSDLVFGVDNDFANKYPEGVYRGELLLVRDSRGNVGTYINPQLLKKLLEDDDIEDKLEVIRKDGVHILSKLNEYMENVAKLESLHKTNSCYKELLEETHKMRKYKRVKKENKHD